MKQWKSVALGCVCVCACVFGQRILLHIHVDTQSLGKAHKHRKEEKVSIFFKGVEKHLTEKRLT